MNPFKGSDLVTESLADWLADWLASSVNYPEELQGTKRKTPVFGELIKGSSRCRVYLWSANAQRNAMTNEPGGTSTNSNSSFGAIKDNDTMGGACLLLSIQIWLLSILGLNSSRALLITNGGDNNNNTIYAFDCVSSEDKCYE